MFKHRVLFSQISFVRIICASVLVGGVVESWVVTWSSHRTPAKPIGQTQTKPPIDVSEHVPPLKHGRIAHALGGVVVRRAKSDENIVFEFFRK